MKLSLTRNAIDLIKFILSTNGEKEMNIQGKETFASRRLNAVDSAQRRHFFKSAMEVTNSLDEKIKEKQEAHKKLVDEKREALKTTLTKLPTEDQKVFDARFNVELGKDVAIVDSNKALNKFVTEAEKEKLEFELTDKTFATVKKIINEFSDKVGFMQGDDKLLEEFESQKLI